MLSSIGALAVGNIIWFFLLKEEEATTLSGSSLIIPAVAMFFGWQILGENFNVASILGSALTIGGICLLNIKRKMSNTPNAHPSRRPPT
jgi:drug/metabolite transporter (DMT)-like permease